MYMLGFSIFNRWKVIEYEYYRSKVIEHEYYIDGSMREDSYKSEENRGESLLPMLLIGPFVGIIFFGFIAMKFGRKTSLLYTSIPMIVSKLIYKVSTNSSSLK